MFILPQDQARDASALFALRSREGNQIEFQQCLALYVAFRAESEGERGLLSKALTALQPGAQRPGCGFPVMQVCGLYSLAGGAILKTVQAPWSANEVRLFKDLWPELHSGDILLGDRPFGAYALLALLPLRGIDVVSRLHQGRRFSRRQAKRIGLSQWLVTWRKPPQRPDYFTEAEWAEVPPQITVRIIHLHIRQKGFRTTELWLSTTLLDPIAYPAEQVAGLYLRRWDMELFCD